VKASPFFIVVIVLALVLQGAVGRLPHPDFKLDLVWLGVLFLGFYVPLMPGGVVVLVLGLAQEALGAPLHGVVPMAYLAVYFVLRLTHQTLFFQKRTSQVVWVALLSLAYRGLETGLLAWQDYEIPAGLSRAAAWALLEGLASIAVFPLFRLGGKIERPYAP
jgi:cell shape-determining protein MreD